LEQIKINTCYYKDKWCWTYAAPVFFKKPFA